MNLYGNKTDSLRYDEKTIVLLTTGGTVPISYRESRNFFDKLICVIPCNLWCIN